MIGSLITGIPTAEAWTMLDNIIVISFLAFLIGVGFFYKNKVTGKSDFFVGDRSVKWQFAAFSMFAQYNSIWAFTGAVGYGYRFGIPVLFFYLGCILGTIGQTFVLAERLNCTKGLTVFSFLQERYSANFRYFVAGSNSLLYFMDGGLRLYATAIVPSVFLGWNPELTVVILFVVCVIYVVLGGMKSIIFLDLIQGSLMFFGFLIVISLGIITQGGFSSIAGLDPRYFKLVSPHFPLMMGLAIAIPSIFTHFMNFGFHGNVLLCVKNPRDARKANIGYASATLTFGLLVALASLLMIVAMPGLEATNRGIERGFIQYMARMLPTGLLGLFLVSALAASLSTVDSQAHNITGWLVTDIYMQKKPNADDKTILRLARVVVAFVLAGFLGTSSFTALTGIFNMVLTWVMPLVSPMSVILAAGLLTKKTTTKVAWITLLSSYVVFLIWTFAKLPYVGVAVPIFALSLITVGSMLTKASPAEQERIDGFFAMLAENSRKLKQI